VAPLQHSLRKVTNRTPINRAYTVILFVQYKLQSQTLPVENVSLSVQARTTEIEIAKQKLKEAREDRLGPP
jgi:hypothetical protein